MKKPQLRIPKLCHHKATGQSYVTIHGERRYLGKHGTTEAEGAYQRAIKQLVAEFAGDGEYNTSINALIIAFLSWAEIHYRKEDGTQTGEVSAYRAALRPVSVRFGKLKTCEFSPLKLIGLRDEFSEENVRKTANKKTFRIRKVFRWGVSREMVPGDVIVRLDTVEGLQANRTTAKESKPVLPVPQADIDSVLPLLTSPVATMIKIQLRTGARPSEVLNIRMEELDTSGGVWIFRPNQHKNKWRGKERKIPIGPESQDLLLPFLIGRKPGDYLFRSADGRREFVEQTYGKDAKTAIRNAETENKPYTIHGYTSSIQKACVAAGVTKWSPGRLRHNAATRINQVYGDIDAARTVLGHTTKSTTEIYAETDFAKACEIAIRVG